MPRSRRPGSHADHNQAGEDRGERDRDLVVEVVRHQRSDEKVDRARKDEHEEREPADLGTDGRRRLRGHAACYEASCGRSAKPNRMDEPRVLASRHAFEGRVFNVRVDEVRYADGSGHRVDVVEHGASLAIVATPAPNELVLVRQYRHPARAALWEIPAGTAELGESLVDGACRELREETGYRTGRIRPIGALWMTPGFCSEVMHFFHAEDLTEGEPAFDEDERIEIGRFTYQAAWRLVASGTADAKTVLALFWLQGGEDEIGSVSRR